LAALREKLRLESAKRSEAERLLEELNSQLIQVTQLLEQERSTSSSLEDLKVAHQKEIATLKAALQQEKLESQQSTRAKKKREKKLLAAANELQVDVNAKSSETQQLRAKLDAIKTQLEEEMKSKAIIEAAQINQEKDFEEARTHMENERRTLREQLQRLERKVEDDARTLRGKLEKSESRRESVESELKALKTQAEALRRELRDDKDNDQLARNGLESQIASLKGQLSDALDSVEKVRKEKGSTSSAELEKLKKELAEQEDSYDKLQTKYKKLLSQVESLK